MGRGRRQVVDNKVGGVNNSVVGWFHHVLMLTYEILATATDGVTLCRCAVRPAASSR